MRQEFVICDRCGKRDITAWDKNSKWGIMEFNYLSASMNARIKKDLCPDCMELLVEFIKGEKK